MTILTVGHSNQSYDRFLELLKGAEVTAIADVRTTPKSRWTPHFNDTVLREELPKADIAYVFMGDQLGGRPKSRALYKDGAADYEAMAKTDEVKAGVDRVIKGSEKHRIALMCTEKEPLECHRCLLVSRMLTEQGVETAHVHGDGRIETHAQLEDRMMRMAGEEPTMFETRDDLLPRAYRTQGLRIAYKEKES